MNVLEHILQAKRGEVEEARSRVSMREMEMLAKEAPNPRGFLAALRRSPHPIALIAEVKKASPVKGLIREDFDPVAIAQTYEQSGADCLSVLTDRTFFQGSAEDLLSARRATALPVLRKDFIVDEYQVIEARAMGADAILLITHGLEQDRLEDLLMLGKSLKMDVLVEVATIEEAQWAIAAKADLIGVNNRDLATFETHMENTELISPFIDERAYVVSESAISSPEDVERARLAGARAVLIGSAFCRAENIAAQVREIMQW